MKADDDARASVALRDLHANGCRCWADKGGAVHIVLPGGVPRLSVDDDRGDR